MTMMVPLFRQIAIMFIFMAAGYLFYKKKMISDQGSKDIGMILLYLVIPEVIVKNFWVEYSVESFHVLLDSIAVSLIAMAVAVIFGMFAFRKNGVEQFSAAFSNAGFIGIPLVTAVLGDSSVFYISMMIVMINLLQWTAGIYMMTKDVSIMKPKKVIANPIVISVVIGLLLFFLPVPHLQLVDTCFELVEGLNTPLAMMVSGVYLAQSDLIAMLKNRRIYLISAVRLIIIPLLTLFAFALVPIGDTQMRLAILIAAACPAGANTAIFAQQYGQDYRSAVQHVCMSTIFCLLSLPLITVIASAVL